MSRLTDGTGVRVGLGRRGEALAAELLQAKGWPIVARNWRCAEGELDLVARDGPMWVVVEVRTRRGRSYGAPEESLTPAKRRHLAQAAQRFMAEVAPPDSPWRIDLAAVELTPAGRLIRLELIHNAVTGADL